MFWLWVYCGVFAQALILSLVLTPLARRLGERSGLLDHPGHRKVHTAVTPRSGGLAIYSAFAGTLVCDVVLFWLLVRGDLGGPRLAPYRANLGIVLPRIAAILAGLTFLFLVGLADDRKGLGPWTKLGAQILSVVPLLMAGIRIDAFLQSAMPPFLAWVGGAMLTAGWVVLLTNSLNFLDNMDGLTAGIGFVISLVLAGFATVNGDVFMTASYLALAGAVLGFLKYNWSPASLFMGDSGSLTIGYALAALTINARYYGADSPTALPVLIPLIVIGVPIFDTASVLFIRWRRGAPLMQGDTNHLSHRLVALGFTKPQAVTFICLLTCVIALMALPLRYLPAKAALLHVAGIGALFVLVFIMERVARREMGK
jgi:UDP-GlcNAc:undecaprenyl-phosphate/decaprenyl-phosphate GlcNAc-1-phosphate transferase